MIGIDCFAVCMILYETIQRKFETIVFINEPEMIKTCGLTVMQINMLADLLRGCHFETGFKKLHKLYEN